jgi:transcriptional regulator with XRE-family HTH domain
MITSGQIRAARSLLRITSNELAEVAEVGIATIRRLELGEGVPPGNSRTLDQVRRALEGLGVEFIGSPEAGPGVRLWRKDEDPIKNA